MKIAVIGAGVMGHGIAQVFAMNRYEVVLIDEQEPALESAKQKTKKSIEKLLEKVSSGSIEEVLSRVNFTTSKDSIKDADIVIEAIIENIDKKHVLYKELDHICKPEAIFASNTSSLSIKEIAFATNRRDRVCGMHFFNPVPLMVLVEINATDETSAETINKAEELVKSIHKQGIRVADTPMFIVNRLLIPMICEAISLVEEGTAKPEDIDKAMKLGAHHPIGPLWLADMIGLDTMFNIQQGLYQENQKYIVPDLLRKMVEKGELGRKSGKGFYNYTKQVTS